MKMKMTLLFSQFNKNYYFQLVFQVNLSFSLRFKEEEKLTGSSHPNERDIEMRIEEMLSTESTFPHT